MKPRVFIGSSSESLPVAHALQSNLEERAEVSVWDQDVFGPSKFILESLLEHLDRTDVGIFVFSPDDVTQMRDRELATVRDNVVSNAGFSSDDSVVIDVTLSFPARITRTYPALRGSW